MKIFNLDIIADRHLSLRSLLRSDALTSLTAMADNRAIGFDTTLIQIASMRRYYYENETRGSKPLSQFTINKYLYQLPVIPIKDLGYIGAAPSELHFVPYVDRDEFMEWNMIVNIHGGLSDGLV